MNKTTKTILIVVGVIALLLVALKLCKFSYMKKSMHHKGNYSIQEHRGQGEHKMKVINRMAQAALPAGAEQSVNTFYEVLSATDTDVATLTAKMQNTITDAWTSNEQAETPVEFAKSVKMYHSLIPDLKWSIVEKYISGNKVIVRGKATGTPVGDFFGVPTDGSKTFEIMSIDIHTVDENGKITQTYHIEEWANAMQQLMPTPSTETPAETEQN